ncbi:MAG: hypothetical protein H7Y07_13785 [Pyrinomonadaceae bacterium]|nr:hypothetical protein [Sphingobacteriaceae bacterium]
MKKGKIKSIVKKARTAVRKDIKMNIVSELQQIASSLGQDSKKLINKSSSKLAKTLSKSVPVDEQALIEANLQAKKEKKIKAEQVSHKRKLVEDKIQQNLVERLKQATGEFGEESPELTKQIEKGSKQLANRLAKSARPELLEAEVLGQAKESVKATQPVRRTRSAAASKTKPQSSKTSVSNPPAVGKVSKVKPAPVSSEQIKSEPTILIAEKEIELV